MATNPTNNQVPSVSPHDVKFNAEKLDQIINSEAGSYTDRLGVSRKTWSAIESDTKNSGATMGFPSETALLAFVPTTANVLASDTSSGVLYYWNGSVWTKAEYQPATTDIDISRLDFFVAGRNIYNYRTALDGKYLSPTGVIMDNATYILSDYIPINASSPLISNYELRFVHIFDADKNLIAYLNNQNTFNTPSGAAYMRITMAALSKELLQIEYGTTITKFMPFRNYMTLETPDKTPLSIRSALEVKPGKNLFNKLTAKTGYSINELGVLIVASTFFVSDYISVTAAGAYRANQPLRFIAFYTLNKVFISALQNINGSFTTPEETVYMRVSVLLTRLNVTQIEAGTAMTPYEDFTLKAPTVIDGEAMAYPMPTVTPYNIGIYESGKNIFNSYTLTDGYIDENGFLVPGGTSYKVSGYLPISESQPYISNKSMRFISFYSSNYGWLSTVTSTSTITPPVGSAFIRVTISVANIPLFQLEAGDFSTSYEDYHYKIKSNLDNGTPVVISPSLSDDATPDSFGLERLRETHQRLNKLSFSVTGLTARLTWAMIGDSYTRDSSRYPLRCARRLWSLYQSGAANVSSGPIGWGYLSFGGADTASSQNGSIVNPSAITQSGFVGTYYGGDSPDISVMQSSTAGSTLSWSEDFRLSRSHTLLAEGGSGVISYQVTGMSAATQIDLSALPVGIQAIPLTDIPTTNNGTMTITVISGTVKLYGMNIVDASAAGVICHKLGASGSSTADWIARNAARWQSSFGSLEANLTTIMMGTNDQGAAMAPETFKANIITMIDRIRAARPTTDILLVCPQENQRTTNTYPMTKYAQAMYEIARDDRDVGFLWLQQSFGVNPADYAYGSSRPWMISDGIHPDPDTGGYAIVAALMRALCLPAV